MAIDSSSSGQYLVVAQGLSSGSVYLSSDFGANFAALSGAVAGPYCSISSDNSGQYITASICNGDHSDAYVSSDFGGSWTKSFNGGSEMPVASAMSGSGQYAALAFGQGGTGIFVSSNYGAFQSYQFVPESDGKRFTNLAISEDGQYMAAVIGDSTESIWLSSDYGETWGASNSPNLDWSCVAMDDSGQILLAASADSASGGLYLSPDYGATFTQSYQRSAEWSSVTSDSSGQILAASINGGVIYSSLDSGTEWYDGFAAPTSVPTTSPPTTQPSAQPSGQPTSIPSSFPSSQPSLTTFCLAGTGWDSSANECVECEGYDWNDGSFYYCEPCPQLYGHGNGDGGIFCNPCRFGLSSSVIDGKYHSCEQGAVLLPGATVMIVIGTMSFLFFLFHLLSLSHSNNIENVKVTAGVMMFTGIAAASSFTHLIYILRQQFYNEWLLLAAVLVYVSPFGMLVYRLFQDSATGKFAIKPPSWVFHEEYDTFVKAASSSVVYSLYTGLNLILFWVPMLLVAFVMYELKLFALVKCRNVWYSYWTGTTAYSLSGILDSVIMHEILLACVLFQALPWAALIVFNTTLMGTWNDITIASIVFSGLLILNSLYRYAYLLLWKRVSVDSIPIQLEIMGVSLVDVQARGSKSAASGGPTNDGVTAAEVRASGTGAVTFFSWATNRASNQWPGQIGRTMTQGEGGAAAVISEDGIETANPLNKDSYKEMNEDSGVNEVPKAHVPIHEFPIATNIKSDNDNIQISSDAQVAEIELFAMSPRPSYAGSDRDAAFKLMMHSMKPFDKPGGGTSLMKAARANPDSDAAKLLEDITIRVIVSDFCHRDGLDVDKFKVALSQYGVNMLLVSKLFVYLEALYHDSVDRSKQSI